jgi:hypothetical protein
VNVGKERERLLWIDDGGYAADVRAAAFPVVSHNESS